MKHTASVMVAIEEDAYLRCVSYCAMKGLPNDVPMVYPTLYLEDAEGNIHGVLSRRPSDDAIMVGRAVADSGMRLVQLAEAFEAMLIKQGIDTYIIPVSRGTELERLLGKLYNEKPYHVDKKHSWFKRKIAKLARA